MSKEEGVSYRDLYPQYAEYVDNPGVTDEPVTYSRLFDLLNDWSNSLEFPYDCGIESFLNSIAIWHRKVKPLSASQHHIFDDYNIENEDQITTMLIKAIEYKLEAIPSNIEKCNFLLGIKKDIDQGRFFVGLHFRNDDKIKNKVVSELEFWQNANEPKLVDSHETHSGKLTHKKVMLLFHYLGLLDKIEALGLKKETEAKLIADIIGFDAKNTQTFIANMKLTRYMADSDVAKTYKNLEFIKKYFSELGLNGFIDKVNEDIAKAEADKS